MPDDDPDELRRRARRYDAMARRIGDDHAVRVLQDMARDLLNRADRAETQNHDPQSPADKLAARQHYE